MGTDGDLPAIWAGVDRLLERADAQALVFHRLEPLAASRLRRLGLDVPPALLEVELPRRRLLARGHRPPGPRPRGRGRAASPRQGPQLRRSTPSRRSGSPATSTWWSPDPGAVQRALLAAGFAEARDPGLYARAPHLVPLAWPGLPVELEVHGRPNWPPWVEAPTAAELLAGARPSAAGVEGVLAPAPEKHLPRRRRPRLDARPAPARPRPPRRRPPGGARGPYRDRAAGGGVGDREALADDRGPRRRALPGRGSAAGAPRLGEEPGGGEGAHGARAAHGSLAQLVGRLPPAARGARHPPRAPGGRHPRARRELGEQADPHPQRGPERVRAPLRARPRRQVTQCYLKRRASR